MTPSLSLTFEPPSTTVYGRSGFDVRRSRTVSSVSMSEPAADGSAEASSYTEACLRCTTPKPSDTKASPNAAIRSAKALRSSASFEVSSGLKRRFSSSRTSPSPSSAAAAVASSPTVSPTKVTSFPRSSESAAPRGERVLRSRRPVGPSEVGDHDDARAGVDERVQRVERRADAAVVGDRAVLERDVQVTPDDDALAGEVAEVAESSERHGLEALAHVLGEVDEAVRVAPLVVVPRGDLHEAADDLGQTGVVDGTSAGPS